MKHIKVFELFGQKVNDAKVGDYVICHINESYDDQQILTDDFLNNNVGKLIDINVEFRHEQSWYVRFEKIPKNITDTSNELYKSFNFKNKTAGFYDDEIDFWAKTKKDVLLMRDVKKYNL